ncbi:ABC1 kinase family protein [Tsukamurella sp. DT100]|uniref:ABC1 kinase family protein n=1 Tax=Tsukamurella sp. DT100 TaxID=3393415 RepID=UPI003CF52280
MDVVVALMLTPVVALLLAAVMRRSLGARPGWLRTVLVALLMIAVALPVTSWAAVTSGIAEPGGTLLVGTGTAVAFFLVAGLWLFAGSLAALVLLEIVAPTGTAPGPRDLLVRARGRLRRTRRYLTITAIAARSGAGSALRAGPSSPEFGPALVRLLNGCGVTFVKLGQILGTRDDLLPADLTRALSTLQSSAEPVATDRIMAVVAAEVPGEPDRAFARFDPTPLAAASVAQVHTARTAGGEEVVVKVQRPEAREQVTVDCDILLRFARTAEQRLAWARDVGVSRLAQGLVASLREELDYRTEAANTAALAATVADRDDVVVPRIDRDLSTSRLLVMERLPGVPLSGGPAVVVGLDEEIRARIAHDLLGALLDGIFVHGVFHADLHPGNIMVLPDGRVGLLDMGAVGVLDGELRVLLAMLLDAALNDDPVVTVDTMLLAFDAPDEVDRETLLRAVGREITLIGLQGGVSAESFGRLFAVLRTHRVGVPGDVAAAFRSLASVERALGMLVPGLDVQEAIRAEMPRLVREVASPERMARRAASTAAVGAAVARRLPGRADRIAGALAAGTFTVRTRATAHPDDRRWLRGRVTDAMGAVLALAAVVAGVVLMVVPGGPAITPQLTAFALAGATVGFVGTVLAMRTVFRLFASDAPG